MITAEATREAVRKGLQAGADGYITKPFEPDCVVTAVREVLGLTAEK
jgi:DNA-binding response OmpR family regulator